MKYDYVKLREQFVESLRGGPPLKSEELDAFLENYREEEAPTPPKGRPEYYLPGSKEWREAKRTNDRLHLKNPVAAEKLQDDLNPILIAYGVIASDNPPTATLGKIINWGGLTRTGVGVYRITVGNGGAPASNSQIITTVISNEPNAYVEVYAVDTSNTDKTFSVFTNGSPGGEGETPQIIFKFHIIKMPHGS